MHRDIAIDLFSLEGILSRKMACPALVSLKDSMRSNKSLDISRNRVETNNK